MRFDSGFILYMYSNLVEMQFAILLVYHRTGAFLSGVYIKLQTIREINSALFWHTPNLYIVFCRGAFHW